MLPFPFLLRAHPAPKACSFADNGSPAVLFAPMATLKENPWRFGNDAPNHLFRSASACCVIVALGLGDCLLRNGAHFDANNLVCLAHFLSFC